MLTLDDLRLSEETHSKITDILSETKSLRTDCLARLTEYGVSEDTYPGDHIIKIPPDIFQRHQNLSEKISALPEDASRFINNGLGHNEFKIEEIKEDLKRIHPCLTMLPGTLQGIADSMALLAKENDQGLLLRHFYLAAKKFAWHATSVFLLDDPGVQDEIRGFGLEPNPLTEKDLEELKKSRTHLTQVFSLLSASEKEGMNHTIAADDHPLPEIGGNKPTIDNLINRINSGNHL